MKWKIYFWIYGIITLLGLYLFLRIPDSSLFNFADYEGVIEGIVLSLAAFSYSFSKKLLPAIIWKCIFVYLIIIWSLQLIIQVVPVSFLDFLNTIVVDSIDATIFSIAISIPALITAYRLGRNQFLKIEQPSKV